MAVFTSAYVLIPNKSTSFKSKLGKDRVFVRKNKCILNHCYSSYIINRTTLFGGSLCFDFRPVEDVPERGAGGGFLGDLLGAVGVTGVF